MADTGIPNDTMPDEKNKLLNPETVVTAKVLGGFFFVGLIIVYLCVNDLLKFPPVRSREIPPSG